MSPAAVSTLSTSAPGFFDVSAETEGGGGGGGGGDDGGFPSTQIGSGPQWQLRGTSPDYPPARADNTNTYSSATSTIPPATSSAAAAAAVAGRAPPAPPPESDLGSCKALGPSWFDILLRIDDACVCSAVTPQGEDVRKPTLPHPTTCIKPPFLQFNVELSQASHPHHTND